MEGQTLEACIAERVRMNLSQTAKGTFQMECTVESGSVERSTEMLAQGIRAMKGVAADEHLMLAG